LPIPACLSSPILPVYPVSNHEGGEVKSREREESYKVGGASELGEKK